MKPTHLMNSILWRNHKILFGSYHDTLERWMNSIMNIILKCTNINQNQIVKFCGDSVYFHKPEIIHTMIRILPSERSNINIGIIKIMSTRTNLMRKVSTI